MKQHIRGTWQTFVAGMMIVGLLPLTAWGQTPRPFAAERSMKVVHNLQYYTGPGADPRLHNLDLYLPEGKTNFPMLFFIHGGGWRVGDKVYPGLDNIVNLCIDMGMGVVSVNYRLSPAIKHPVHVEDVARAFAWLYENGSRYGANRDQIFVSGGSAGGHLAALVSLDPRYLEAHGLSPKIIRGVMPLSGAYDMAHLYTVGRSPGAVTSQTLPTAGNSVEGDLYEMIKQSFGTDYDLLKSASPAQYVGTMGPETPPFLVAYVEDDMWGFDEQAIKLYGLFMKHKIPVELVQQPGRIHSTKTTGIGHYTTGADDVLGPAMVRFMRDNLSGVYRERANAIRSVYDAPAVAVEALKDIPYVEGGDPRQTLDLYLPTGRDNLPLIFNVHGGGWRGGDKRLSASFVKFFTGLGFAVASVNYRLSPGVKHPAHIQDVARGFSWIYNNAARHRIDRDRIGIIGSSAGGHLVALLGLGSKHLVAADVPAGAIKAVVAVSGIYDFVTWPEPGVIPTREEDAFGTDVTALSEASPVTYASDTAPPVLLTVTNWDIFMLREQALQLFHELLGVGASVELLQVPGRDHGYTGTIGDFVTSTYIAQDVLGPTVARFMMERLAPRAAPTSSSTGSRP